MTSWYYAKSTAPNMEQIVIQPENLVMEKCDRMLMLTAAYIRVYQSYWISVLLRPDDQSDPVLLIKANQSTEFLKDQGFKIGLSFIKGPTGNVFATFVEFDGPYPFNCPTKPLVFFEDILGLDFAESRERILSNLDFENLNIWFAEGGSATETDGMMQAEPVSITYEGRIAIDPACRDKLLETANAHFTEHLQIESEGWDYQATVAEFAEHMPITDSPILSPDGAVKEDSKAESQGGGERELSEVVLFFKGDPGYSTLPSSLQEQIFASAKDKNLVITSKTQFHVFRNSKDNVKSASNGESIALIAMMEISLMSGGKDPKAMTDSVMDRYKDCGEVFLKGEGWLKKKTPDCAVVFVPV